MYFIKLYINKFIIARRLKISYGVDKKREITRIRILKQNKITRRILKTIGIRCQRSRKRKNKKIRSKIKGRRKEGKIR